MCLPLLHVFSKKKRNLWTQDAATAATTVKIGGADDNIVGQVAHGLMQLTRTTNPVPYERAFEAIKTGIDHLSPGVKMFLNSGEFYDNNASTAGLDLLAAFFEKYPDYADKTFLSVKGGLVENGFEPDSSPENLRRSVDRINEHLCGRKKLDLFELARIDPKVSVEDVIKTLSELVKEGKFSFIGLSECSADTLRTANAIHPIAVAEIELSPWSYEDEAKKVIATAKELDVVVIAYAPLGRGFLTGQIKSREDIPEGDVRLKFSRFSEENIQKNIKIVEKFKAIAENKEVTLAQLSLAWIGSLGPHIVAIPGTSNKSHILENLASASISLSKKEVVAMNKVIAENKVSGDLYYSEVVDAHVGD